MIDLAPQQVPPPIELQHTSIDLEALVDQVWHDLVETVPRPIVLETVAGLVAKYDDATIRTYVPMLVRREASNLLRTANLTEVEAKFKVTDPQMFWQLQTCTELAGFELSPSRTMQVWDTYLDTARRAILRCGFSCRQRKMPNGVEMTLKSLDYADGAIHRRSEWRVALPAVRPPDAWPESQVRDRVRRMIGSEPLAPLFKLKQMRIVRQLHQGNQAVVELSMDSVTMTAGGREQVFRELEIELMPAMPELKFAQIVRSLQERWALQPEPLSKFERGLTVLDSAPC